MRRTYASPCTHARTHARQPERTESQELRTVPTPTLNQTSVLFTKLVRAVLKELEGSFAFVSKSRHYLDEVVTAHRGPPLLVSAKTDRSLLNSLARRLMYITNSRSLLMGITPP